MKFLNSILILSALSMNAVRGDVKYFNKCIHDGDFAITFDDGPHLEYTEKVLDVLDEFNVKATFFVNGRNCVDITENSTAQKLLKREFESGHVIGSHTFSHPLNGITQLSDEQLESELTNLNNALYDIIGVKPNFFRPPLGEYNERNLKVIEKSGIKANILWNLDSEDWDVNYNATQQYIDALEGKDASSNSFISLNHDIQKVTALTNLKIVIPYIKSLGYNLVTMDKCTGIPPYQDGKDYTKDRSGNDKPSTSEETKTRGGDTIVTENPTQNLNVNPTPNPDSNQTPAPTPAGTETNTTTTTTPEADLSTDGAFTVKASFWMSSALLAVVSYLFL